MKESEFKKQIHAAHDGYEFVWGLEDFDKLIAKAAQDFPSLERLKEAVKMAESQLDFKAHGFSSRWILAVLKETYEAREKWLGAKK